MSDKEPFDESVIYVFCQSLNLPYEEVLANCDRSLSTNECVLGILSTVLARTVKRVELLESNLHAAAKALEVLVEDRSNGYRRVAL